MNLRPRTALVRPVHRRDAPTTSSSKVLMVASGGGHVKELSILAQTLSRGRPILWVTFDSDQTRSLLGDQDVRFISYVAPRDALGLIRAFWAILTLIAGEEVAEIYSTGSGIAVPAFLAGMLMRRRRTYIESVSRVAGPSLTGRIVQRGRLAALRSQHQGTGYTGWASQTSVFADFEKTAAPTRVTGVPGSGLRLLVTLGTIRPYRFDALIDALLRAGVVGEDSVWQLGSTTRTDLPGRVFTQMPHDQLLREAALADVVITHAGVGTILDLFAAGINPVIVPRRHSRREHVDDHQQQIAGLFSMLGLGEVCDASMLSLEVLDRARAFSVVPSVPGSRTR